MRSNTIPDFRDITVDFVTIYLWALYLSRFSHLASTGKQSDPTRGLSRFRDVEKRGGWKELDMDQRLNTIASKFLSESCACNLRSETWRRWLSACLRTHLMCAPSRNNFEGTFAGNGKRRVLFCADKTPRLNAAASVHVCVFVLLCANTLLFRRPIY